LDESPLTSDFLKQYYISQEYQGGPIDLSDNLDQYLNLDNLTPDVVVDSTTTAGTVTVGAGIVTVTSTKGFPNQYGLLKIDDEIITYTGIAEDNVTFTGCIRGFSGITSYHQDLNSEELIFSTSNAAEHAEGVNIQNLSSLFLKEFYKKTKKTFTPGLEGSNFTPELNVGNFIREAKSLYDSKGTDESFRILFNVLYNEKPEILKLEENLIKPSSAEYVRRRIAIAEPISGNPLKLEGESIFKSKLNTDINVSVSHVEPFNRIGIGTYYKFELFVDNTGSDDVSNNFTIIPNTKSIESVVNGSSIITVDSTVGFTTSGTIVSGINSITYTDKTVNQFLNCTWKSSSTGIGTADNIRSDDYYYGYEDGDITKEVKLRFTGVISDFIQSEPLIVDENDIISVKSIGDKVENPQEDKSYKQIFANSWIYNTSSSYKLKSLNVTSGSASLYSIIDRSSLKIGDRIEVVDDTLNRVIYPLPTDNIPYVSGINISGNSITINNFFDNETWNKYKDADLSIRRKIKTANSLETPIKFGNDVVTSDVQNVYFDTDSGYVASNSLPSYSPDASADDPFPYNAQITSKIISSSILGAEENKTKEALVNVVNSDSGIYSTIQFTSPVKFETGDKIYYQPLASSLVGIETGIYYIGKINPEDNKVLVSGSKTISSQIRLYGSNSGILIDEYIGLSAPLSNDGTHTFTLYSQKSGVIGPQKLLKKFPLSPNIKNGNEVETTFGGIGMLINGVEIENYKSLDKLYYGPLESVTVLNGGSNYDVINPPDITISTAEGTTALVQPVLEGSIDKVYIEKQDFDIDKIVSIGITGGNGSGYSLEPVIKPRTREISFSARGTLDGGGISTSTGDDIGKITFDTDHYLEEGEQIRYQSMGNPSPTIGIGESTLNNFSIYYSGKFINSKTIRLYETEDDYIAGINTVRFNGIGGSGIHKFHTVKLKNTLVDIEVLNGGHFENRKLLVNPSGISTNYNTITFKNHGFKSGELIEYSSVVGLGSTEPRGIEGLDVSKQYYIVKKDDNSFKLCDAGIGGTIKSNYISKNIVGLGSTGTGYQQFKYPDIKGVVDIISAGSTYSSGITSTITITPSIKGSVTDLYLYNNGTGYGSTIFNNKKDPNFIIKTGEEAALSPNVINGQINSVNIGFGGREYFSIPDLEVIDPTGKGSGAEIRPIVVDQKITGVEISNPGIGYSITSSILVKPAGQDLKLGSEIRALTINNKFKYGNDRLVDTENNLKYTVLGYDPTLFDDSISNGVSKIIGWAYDGNPIYGPFGYSDPDIRTSDTEGASLKRLESGYVTNSSKVIDRPTGFEDGFFVEDYEFVGGKDLDVFNGRFERTVDFPNGVYAYHAVINNVDESVFPYFVGDYYRSLPIPENITPFNQSTFDFNNSEVLRNTFPYKVSDYNANNDFIIESNESSTFYSGFNQSKFVETQEIEIESISRGSITGFNILNSGTEYKTNEILKFDNSDTEGDGLSAKIRSIKGKDIHSIETDVEINDNALITWDEDKLDFTILPNHQYNEHDYVVISGVSTDLSNIFGSYKIGITSFVTNTISTTLASTSAGFTTEIYVARIPESVSVGSSIQIGAETLRILNVFENLNVLRVKRGGVNQFNLEHPAGIAVTFVSDSFQIDKKIDYFESSRKDKIYFNPSKSVGIGTTPGTTYPVSFEFAGNDIVRNIPVRQLYIENHPFKNNQKVNLTIPSGFASGGNNQGKISISTDRIAPAPFDLPSSFYVVDKGVNTIGIKTGIGTASDGYEYEDVYFRDIHSMNNDEFLLESADTKQVTCRVERIKSVVSVSTVGTPNSGLHELSNNDQISLVVKPNISTGIGSDSNIEIKRDLDTGHLLVNQITFNVGNVNTTNNTITLGSKGFNLKTGDKVLYSGDAVGLSTGNYYVYKVDDKIIKLSETYYDATLKVPNTINITSTGSSGQFISLVNPQIIGTKDTKLIFDHSDSSMNGYNFKLYYDNEFKNEFVSTGIGTLFNVSESNNITTVGYSTNTSKKLYYNIEKSGFISTSDTDVSNYSEILFIDSVYNGNYNISGVGASNFTIFLDKIPENVSYASSECNIFEYTTKSKSAKGPIDKIDIVSDGYGYRKVPTFVGIGTNSIGKDAIIIPKSDDIGIVSKFRIVNEGFEYASDKTLQPTAYISPIIELKNSNTIGIITVTSGGLNYLDEPDVVIVDSNTGDVIENGFLVAEMLDSSITSVNIEEKPYGLPDSTVKIKTKNNSNGFSIRSVDSSYGNPSQFKVELITPTLGFPVAPLKTNDKVFIEGIQKYGTEGTGHNSTDYGYEFLKITSTIGGSNPNPFIFVADVVGLGTNVGVAVTTPTTFTSVVLASDYPILNANQLQQGFGVGETLISNGSELRINVTSDDKDTIKVDGLDVDNLSVDDIIIGKSTGNKATISKIIKNNGKYKVGFSNFKDIGWFDMIGELSSDTQVIPNNDYYQNLSYSIKSSIEWDTLEKSVNNVLHTSGLKNFADTGITSTASIGIGSASDTTIIQDIFGEKRVDELRDIDLVRDTDVVGDVATLVEFKHKRLSDYIECLTNDVFVIDNINEQFSNLQDTATYYSDVLEIPPNGEYTNLLIRVNNIGKSGITTQIQLSELVILNSYKAGQNNDNFLLEKYQIINSIGDGEYVSDQSDRFGSFEIFNDSLTGKNTLRFNPTEKFYNDYDLKILKSNFTNTLSGISSINVGPINLVTFIGNVKENQTGDILSVGISSINSLFANTQIVNNNTGDINFVESYITHDGQDSFHAESFVDSNLSELSSNKIGILTSVLSGGVLSFKYENNTSDAPSPAEDDGVTIRTKIVGFGTTGFIGSGGYTGLGTYRFNISDQPDGSERTLIYQGISTCGVGTTTIIELHKDLFNATKSIVQVSVGASQAVHEVLSVHDGTNIFVQPAQFMTGISSPVGDVGLGTFGGKYDGNNLLVSFYPDDLVGITTVSIFNQCMYSGIDRTNIPGILYYGNEAREELQFSVYNAINGFRINRKDFELTKDSIPIYAKTFNPDSTAVNLVTGQFSIDDHFFRSAEKLSYTPKSTIVGVGSTPMLYKNASANIIDELPSTVFAIRNTDNTFQISTTRSGSAVTFTDVGEGNAHVFAMTEPNQKSLIRIDDIAQYPITPTPISHTLKYNDGGQIGIADTTFSLSGISTIIVGDILKIDDEYMHVVNVGVGTTGAGPVTPGIGTFPVVSVERGAVGSISAVHTNSTQVDRLKGNYNIVESTLWFTTPPRGNPSVSLTSQGLPFPTSDFAGRTFLRNDYSTNDIYDDISDQFNGITTQFTLTVGGANTIGIGTTGGNGILFINGVFQTPTTDNNPANNFKIIESGSGATGVTSVIFSGITSVTTDELIISEENVNNNQLPRGGVPIAYGSTTGSGYAPLVGARVKANLDQYGTITSIVGIPTVGDALGIHTAAYNHKTGILTVTTLEDHQLVAGGLVDEVKLSRLGFQCPSGHEGITTTYFPSGAYGDTFSVVGITSTTEFTVNVGTSTIPHTYVGAGNSAGTAYPYYGKLTLGSGYNSLVSIAVTVVDSGYEHRFVSADTNSLTKTTWNGTGITPTNATYHSLSGIVTFTATSHGLVTDDLVGIATGSLGFTCSRDNHASVHLYPRGPYTHIYNGGTATNAFAGAYDVTNAVYNASTGDLVLTLDSVVGLNVNDEELITANSLSFTCSKDGHSTTHTYPRFGDPAYGTDVKITNISGNNVTVNVGASNTKEDPVAGILTTVTKINDDLFKVFVGCGIGSEAEITATPKTYNTHQFDQTHTTGTEHILVGDWNAGSKNKTVTDAKYYPHTGIVSFTIGASHGVTSGNVGIKTSSIAFRCNQDDYKTVHLYPRTTDPVNGVLTPIVDANSGEGWITVNVGKSNVNCGGALDFTIENNTNIVGTGGTNYTNPEIFVSSPSYSGLGITGISRRGQASTTDTGFGLLVDITVGASQTSGISSGFFDVTNYSIARSGYSFKEGDVFAPVGLVTDRRLYEPFENATMEIEKTYTDDFAMWQFGEFDYIDSIKNYQNSVRTRFPLFYNGSRISVDDSEEFNSALANVMFVVINGVIQEPGKAYYFIGGSSINFAEPPMGKYLDKNGKTVSGDDVAIFFYKGTDSADSKLTTGIKSFLEVGDKIQVSGIGTIFGQRKRTTKYFHSSTEIETNPYTKLGINEDTYRPLSIIRQKNDIVVDKLLVSKKRIELEPRVIPTAKIISDIDVGDTSYFVDDAHLFDYETDSPQFNAIISTEVNPVSAAITAIVSNTGTISALDIVSGGSNYTSVPLISIGIPTTGVGTDGFIRPDGTVGVGSTATATVSLSNGSISGTPTITMPGLGYTWKNPPQVLVDIPSTVEQKVVSTSTLDVQSTSGIITGIGTTTVGSSLGIKFIGMSTISEAGKNNTFDLLTVGSPIYIYNTTVGNGITSRNTADNAIVGIGTTFADNIYSIAEFSKHGTAPNIVGIITCIIKSDTITDVGQSGIAATGIYNPATQSGSPVGNYSVGKISGFTAGTIAVSVAGLTVDSGLTTFPTFQRRGRQGSDTFKQTGGLDTPT